MNRFGAAVAKGVLALAAVTGSGCLAVAAGWARGEQLADFVELSELLEKFKILR